MYIYIFVRLMTSVQLHKFFPVLSQSCAAAVKRCSMSRVEGRKPGLDLPTCRGVGLLPRAPVQQHAAMLPPRVSLNFVSISALLRTDERSISDLTRRAGRYSWARLRFRQLEFERVLLRLPTVLFFWVAPGLASSRIYPFRKRNLVGSGM